MERVAIIGYSGHALVVLDACAKLGLQVQYYCEPRPRMYANPYELTYLGDEGSEEFEWDKVGAFVLGIGDNNIRGKIIQRILENSKKLITVIHPTGITNDFVQVGTGSFLGSNTVINPLTNIGYGCIINTGAIIEHECSIGNVVHIAPGAVLAGNVFVGDNTFIGTNSAVRQGLKIGKNVVVGAGSVVVKDIPDNEKWVGNPARKME